MVTHTEDADNSADPDFDPTDFLFGPEPEPDPAAFLLDPEPATTTKPAVSLYQEIIAKPSARPTAKPDEAHALQRGCSGRARTSAGSARSAARIESDERKRKDRAVHLEFEHDL